MSVMITFAPGTDFSSDFFDRNGIFNLLFNLGAGLPPEYLTEREIALLVTEYGPNWKTEMGYTEPSEQLLKCQQTSTCSVKPKKATNNDQRNLEPKRPIPRYGGGKKSVKLCTNGCGKEGYVIPSGDFSRTKQFCPDCYHKKYPRPCDNQ